MAEKLYKHRPGRKAIIISAIVLIILLLLSLIQFWPINTRPVYGFSFSHKYARELGIDSRKAYVALLNEFRFKHVRLSSYWDEHEKIQGQYHFDELDWQFDEALKRNVRVSLSVGLRQPRWPECHEPEWARRLPKSERDIYLQRYLDEVTRRYRAHPSLESWQLENEAQNRAFGECNDHDRSRINNEYRRLKQLDSKHPIIMSLSDQHGLPLGQPVPDKYGISVYRVFYNKLGPDGYITYPTPLWYHRLRTWAINLIHDRPIVIHELQLEPWGPESIPKLSVEEQNKSMNPERMKKNLAFARQINAEQSYLWGAEWWYWRKTTMNDPSIWNIVMAEIKK